MQTLRKISLWAYIRPRTTRVILTFLNLALAVAAWQAAVHLFAADIKIPIGFYHGGIMLFLVSVFLYPIRRARYKFWKQNYLRQKILDGCLLLSYLLIVMTWTNVRSFQAYNYAEGAAEAEFIVMQNGKVKDKTVAEAKFSRKTMRKKFKEYVRTVKQKREKRSPFGDLLLGLLYTLLITGIVLGVLALSCSLACSGADGAAIIVFIGGVALIVFLITLIAKSKVGKKKKRYKPSTDG